MSDEATQSGPKRAAPILTRENHERWFRLLEDWFVGQGLWCVVDPENAPPKNSAGGALFPEPYGVDLSFLGKKEEQANLAIRADARARYQIVLCINDDDEELVSEDKRARAK